ncbi:MAG: hypothetical protein AAF903_03280 [Pseudomonadota bacterium]
MRIGLLPLARPTFDVAYAEEKLAAQLEQLNAFANVEGHHLIGGESLLMDGDTTLAAMDDLKAQGIDHLLVLQVSFTDAAMVAQAATRFACPLSIWAVTEPRQGGRLRLNAFCGLNLAAHALGLRGKQFSWAFADALSARQLSALLDGSGVTKPLPLARDFPLAETDAFKGRSIAKSLNDQRIARLGEHPDGFDTCAYDPSAIKSLCGVSVDALDLNALFDTANGVSDQTLAPIRAVAEQDVDGLGEVDEVELTRSLKLKAALDTIRAKGDYSAFAIRCWPETFTEYGGAVCGPVSQMGERFVPCACEADVFGALTQMVLQAAADAPVFLTDLVDMDADDNTGVVWHCGQAPISMRGQQDEAIATIHTNRKMPLLYEFALKPGQVTLMRLSQARGETHMVIARGKMLDRPRAFTGTSGVLQFDRSVPDVLNDMMDCGLEHHMALAYGNHVDTLKGVAAALNLPVLEL